MNSVQISIEASEDEQEILISQLSDLDAEGFEQTENYLIAYFNENRFRSYDLNEILKDYSFETIIVEEKNWNEEWERNFQPVVVDDFCAIRAEFHQPINNVEHEIIITPKMSFGTGHHATTYMMIAQMRNMDFKNKTVFDFGTGTGILAILAEQLGASKISAIDVDDWSIDNAKENIARNNCSKVSLNLSSQVPPGQFDVILANINRNVILNYLTQLKESLRAKSYLLISGLLTHDQKDIMDLCNLHGLELIKITERSNWISLLFANR